MKLSATLKSFLSKKHGKKVNVEEIKTPLIAVGDIVTYTLIKNNIFPTFAVFDLKTERKEVSYEIKKTLISINPLFVGENKRGEINENLIPFLKYMVDRGGALYVDGEEDSLAFLLLLMVDIPIIYGRRNEGMFLINKKNVKIPKNIKQELKDSLPISLQKFFITL